MKYPTQADIKKLFIYKRGCLIWKVSNNKAMIGRIAGYLQSDGYTRIGINGKGYAAHILIYIYHYNHIPDGHEIDHINGERSDNRIRNLRVVTNQENKFNNHEVKGYCWHKIDKKWQASIKLNKKSFYLGGYNTKQEARKAYMEAKATMHKILAKT